MLTWGKFPLEFNFSTKLFQIPTVGKQISLHRGGKVLNFSSPRPKCKKKASSNRIPLVKPRWGSPENPRLSNFHPNNPNWQKCIHFTHLSQDLLLLALPANICLLVRVQMWVIFSSLRENPLTPKFQNTPIFSQPFLCLQRTYFLLPMAQNSNLHFKCQKKRQQKRDVESPQRT